MKEVGGIWGERRLDKVQGKSWDWRRSRGRSSEMGIGFVTMEVSTGEVIVWEAKHPHLNGKGAVSRIAVRIMVECAGART